MLDQQDNWIIF